MSLLDGLDEVKSTELETQVVQQYHISAGVHLVEVTSLFLYKGVFGHALRLDLLIGGSEYDLEMGLTNEEGTNKTKKGGFTTAWLRASQLMSVLKLPSINKVAEIASRTPKVMKLYGSDTSGHYYELPVGSSALLGITEKLVNRKVNGTPTLAKSYRNSITGVFGLDGRTVTETQNNVSGTPDKDKWLENFGKLNDSEYLTDLGSVKATGSGTTVPQGVKAPIAPPKTSLE